MPTFLPEKNARDAVLAGGYISVFGNGARFHTQKPHELPLGSQAHVITSKVANRLIAELGLVHFANGSRWPYPSLYRMSIEETA